MDKRTISLPAEHASYIDQKVQSGDFASASEVVRAGLRALQERDRAIESWLHNQVGPTFDAMTKDPSRGLTGDQVFGSIQAIHEAKGKAPA